MKPYLVSYAARQDLVSIWKFVARENRLAASKILKSFVETFEVTQGRYIVFYRTPSGRRQHVEIIRIIHEARDLNQFFPKASLK